MGRHTRYIKWPQFVGGWNDRVRVPEVPPERDFFHTYKRTPVIEFTREPALLSPTPASEIYSKEKFACGSSPLVVEVWVGSNMNVPEACARVWEEMVYAGISKAYKEGL